MTSRPTLLRRAAASVVTALAVTAIVHVATLLLFLTASQVANPVTVDVLNQFFFSSSLILFVLLLIAAFVGMYRRWFITLPVALVIAAVSTVIGTAIQAAQSGAAITAANLPDLIGTLLTNNLFYVVATGVVTVTAGAALWRWIARGGLGASRNIALVRLNSSKLGDGELTHLERVEVDGEKADAQWESYVAALEAGGFTAVEVDAADDHPDAAFIEDTVVILGNTAVITSPGAESRRGETAGVEGVIKQIGLTINRISLPGTLDGGDVLKVGTTVYVGRSGRTNAEGIRQFRDIATLLGYSVVAVPVKKVLHLKSAVTALPDGTIVGLKKNIDSIDLFGRYLGTPEAHSAVVALPNGSLLMSASAPKTRALYIDLGYTVVTVDISEFEKLEGCVTCLSVRIR
ncbi:MAG: dimethylarginine dimethylaminohydrolase [Glaciihabitans sp.]|nr:dimethylarginine dimethylaminohydrolase [Glaciihabitans sp.]